MFKHGADQLIIRRCLDVNEEKMCFYLKIVFFTVFFGLFCIFLLIGAVDFDDLTVFLPSHCQLTFFPRLYKFVVSIAK